MRRVAQILVGLALVVSIAPSAAASLPPPAYAPPTAPPELGAAAWLVYDVTTDTILAEHNSDEGRPMASVTKLMSALVAVDAAPLDDRVVISQTAADVGEAEIGLAAGEIWTMRDLLAAMLVRSGNDAAVAVAEHIGGSVEGFAALMNAKAAEMGLTSSQFSNPHGLDEPNHFTSARDLLVMARAVLAHPMLSRLVRTKVVRFAPDADGESRRAVNTNALLGRYPGVIGLKTGFTGDAGRVLVAAAEEGDRTLITVVMGSQDHFADTRRLFEYGFGALGPADLMRVGAVEPEGGGAASAGQAEGVVASPLPTWMQARLGVVPRLDSGRHLLTPAGGTPATAEIDRRLGELLPAFAVDAG